MYQCHVRDVCNLPFKFFNVGFDSKIRWWWDHMDMRSYLDKTTLVPILDDPSDDSRDLDDPSRGTGCYGVLRRALCSVGF